MKTNKYVVKYAVPKIWGPNIMFYTFANIECKKQNTAKEIFDTICSICIADCKKQENLTPQSALALANIQNFDIDFKMISLVDLV